MLFPSPHPGIINFFPSALRRNAEKKSFRPLIRGLSISSSPAACLHASTICFRPLIRGLSISSVQPVSLAAIRGSFRPLIRGLSISSAGDQSQAGDQQVSVPSSGDYQFLLPWSFAFSPSMICFRPLIRGLSISSSWCLNWHRVP